MEQLVNYILLFRVNSEPFRFCNVICKDEEGYYVNFLEYDKNLDVMPSEFSDYIPSEWLDYIIHTITGLDKIRMQYYDNGWYVWKWVYQSSTPGNGIYVLN